jgi:copper transport protein
VLSGGLHGQALARSFALALVGAALLTVAGAVPVLAHTALLGSDPADGSVLGQAPSKVALDFTSDVAPQLTRAAITDSHGHTTQLPPGAISVDRRYSTRLWIQLPSRLPRDSYRLSFDTHDSDDLHETTGSIVFGVATSPVQPSQTAAAAPPNPIEAGLRWISFLGLSALLGALALAFGVLPRPLRLRTAELARAQRRLFTIALSGVAIIAAGQTALLALQLGTAGAGGDLVSLVLSSGFGRRWLVSVAFAIGLAPLIWWLRRGVVGGRPAAGPVAELRREGAWARLSTATRVCLLAAGQAVALAVSGHSGGDAAPTVSDVALRTLHLVSTSAWAGGLLGLSAVLSIGSLRALAWPVLRAFSPFAAVCFAGAAVTGLLLSGGEVASITALLATGYGLTLVAKVVLVAAVGLLGLRHAIRIARRRRSDAEAPPRTLRLEALGAVLVILAAGVLASSQPALGRQFDPPPPAPPPSAQTADVGDLVVRLSIEPNRPGQNLVSVYVATKRQPAPAAVDDVKVVLARPGRTAQTLDARTGDGFSRFDAGAVDLTAGDMAVNVEVHRSPLPATTQRFGWSVPAAQVPRHPVVVSDARYSSLSAVAAALLTLAGAIFAGAILWRRRRSPAGPRQGTVGQRGRSDRQTTSR